MPRQTDELEPDRASALASDLRGLLRRMRRRLREQAEPDDLTWSQVAILFHLERDGPATVTNLARAEGIRPQSMGATVASLEAAGLVKGTPDPEDGRQTLISLTDASREWIRKSRAARQDWLVRTIRAKLDPAEQHELAAALDLIRRLVDE